MSDLRLVETCGACPEQYDVFDEDGNNVGYLRLRHGYFRAEYNNEVVYDAYPEGDGIFEWDERNYYLNRAVAAIKAEMGIKEDSPLGKVPIEEPLGWTT